MLGNFIRTKDHGALVRIVGHSFGPEIRYPMYIKSQVCDRVHLEVMVFQVNISQPSTSVVSWHILWHTKASLTVRRLQTVSFCQVTSPKNELKIVHKITLSNCGSM